MKTYCDRREAGWVLSESLKQYANQPNILVLALARGGVPVAYEVANALNVPLDVFVVRKLGVPSHPELAMGAIARGGLVVFNQTVIQAISATKEVIQAVIQTEKQELKRRELAYRDDRPFPALTHQTIILVDDGVATGATMKAAIQALRALKVGKLVVAVPVCDPTICNELSRLVDHFVCPLRPSHLNAVGSWYDDFSQTEDEEVRRLLAGKGSSVFCSHKGGANDARD